MGTATSTILFTDVVGSTVLRSRLGEEEADRTFRALERLLGEIVTGHGGRVVKTAGDGIMAAFDSATDAVRAAVAVQGRASVEHPLLPLRLGAATGDVSWEGGDCHGMPVVTAARLQARAQGGQILVGSVTRALAGDRSGASFQSVGALELAGIAEPVEAFDVPWAEAEEQGGAFELRLPGALTVPFSSAFVGREAQLDDLAAAWARVRAGERRMVLIGGEAGAGKTRLAFEFARRRAGDGAAVVLGSCDAELALPYQPFVQILDQVVTALAPARRRLLAAELADAEALLPQLDRLMPGLHPSTSADAETERYRMFAAVDRVLASVARERPLLVIVDDLHWAATPTLTLLRYLSRSNEPAAIFIVGTFRDTDDEVTEPLAGFLADQRRNESTARVALGGLEQRDVERYVREDVGNRLEGSVVEVATMLRDRTAGNAFYLGELWRHLTASGLLAGPDGVALLAPASVPDSVRDVVGARLTRLSPGARMLVDCAAVIGLRFDADVCISATSAERYAAGPALDELVRARVLAEIPGGVEYQFAHAIVRDTVESHLSTRRRADLHHDIALALEVRLDGDHRIAPADLARHFRASGRVEDRPKAARYAREAAAQASRSGAHAEAIEYLTAVLQLVDPDGVEHAEVLIELGDAAGRAGDTARSLAAYEQALLAAEQAGLAHLAVRAALGHGDASAIWGVAGPRSAALARIALRLVADDTADAVRVSATLARSLYWAGDPNALAVYRTAIDLARRLGQGDVLLFAMQSALHILEDDLEQLTSLMNEACALAEKFNPWNWCYVQTTRIRCCFRQGAMDRALIEIDRLAQVATRERFGIFPMFVEDDLVTYELAMGRFDEAERHAERSRQLAEAIEPASKGVYGMQMFAIRREQGRLGEVAGVLRAAAALRSEPLWRPGLAVLLVEVGLVDQARREFEALAPDDFAAVERDALWPCCLTFLADVCVALDDPERAATLYRELSRLAGQVLMAGFSLCQGPVDRFRGKLAVALGRPDDARTHFRDALALAQRAGSPVWEAHVQHDWATALGECPEMLDAARTTAQRLGMRGLVQRIDHHRRGPEVAPALPDGLSAREVEVLQLVAAGRSNRAIADRLFISQNTVAHHVRSVLMKTASANRAEAAAYAVRRGLAPSPDRQ